MNEQRKKYRLSGSRTTENGDYKRFEYIVDDPVSVLRLVANLLEAKKSAYLSIYLGIKETL